MKTSRKLRRVISVVVFVVLLGSFTFATNLGRDLFIKDEVTLSLAFYHKGIDEGLDPNGNKFDIYEVKDRELIAQALTAVELESLLDVETVERSIAIRPVVPANILEKMQEVPEDEGISTESILSDGYHPNEYKIGLRKMEGISTDDHEALLGTLVDAYIQSYYDKYFLIQSDLFSLTEERLMSYDYPEMIDSLDNEITVLANYVQTFRDEDAFFRGSADGKSFGDLEQKILLLKSVNLSKLSSYIGAYHFTKDREERIELLRYQIEREANLSSMQEDAREVLQSVIDKFEKDTALLFMGSESTPVELENRSSYYNTLISRYTDAGVASSNALRNIEQLNSEIVDLENMMIPYDLYIDIKREIEYQASELLGRIDTYKDETYALIKDYYNQKYYGQLVERVGIITWE